ncbi:hypothetical protein CDD83_10519 [Cordyceps sp. RAO-2017]|nr:hypothetical protein CDD83_10519 [Cordyceps sp. RAO-2017]
MMLLRALTPLAGLVSLAQAGTLGRRRLDVPLICGPERGAHGHMVLQHLWEPGSVAARDNSWTIDRLWNIKPGASAAEEACDASRAYDNITAATVYWNVWDMVNDWRLMGYLSQTQLEQLMAKVRPIVNSAEATTLLADNGSFDVLATAGYRDYFEYEEDWDVAKHYGQKYVPISSLQNLHRQLGDARGVEPFLQRAWARDGTCVGALALDCFKQNVGFERGMEAVAYVHQLGALITGGHTYQDLADRGIVPSDAETYAREDVKSALEGRGYLYTGNAVLSCHQDVLVGVKYYFDIEGHFDSGAYHPAALGSEAEKDGNCPDRVRYLASAGA